MHPKLITAAFRLARSGASPKVASLVQRAEGAWADGRGPHGVAQAGRLATASGGFADAVACANRAGVGGVFVAAVADVAALDVIAEIEEKAGRELTPAEQTYADMVVAKAKATAGEWDAQQLAAWVVSNTPQGMAYDQGVYLGESVRSRLAEAGTKASEVLAQAQKEGRAWFEWQQQRAVDLLDRTRDAGTNLVWGLGLGALALGAFWVWSESPRRQGPRKRGA